MSFSQLFPEPLMASSPSPGLVHSGLLILRLGIGATFIIHGYPKLMAGPIGWENLGQNMAVFHITFLPVFWGFMAAFAETIGGFLVAIGLLVRPAAFLILCTMIVATGRHISLDQGFNGFSHALELAVVALSLVVAGGGPYSFGHIVLPLRDQWYE